jgi:phenylpropionate dioxygenase-like ring-hydroxylating dioxygenase large terminal subunit
LGPLAAELESFGFASHVPYAPRQLSVACNWKLMIDGSFEAYHFKIAHRATIAAMFADNVQLIDDFGLNRRLYLVKTELATAGQAASAGLDVRAGGNIIYYFFPNTLILVQRDHAQVSRLAPTGTDTTIVHDIALIPAPPDSDKATRHWERNVELYRRALGEDYAQMESMQSTLRSGANQALTFGAFEFAAARFHADLEAELDRQ